MHRRQLLSTAVAVGVFAAGAWMSYSRATKTPVQVSLVPQISHLGKLPAPGVARKVATIRNMSPQEANISRLRSDCPCVKVSPTDLIVPAFASANITLEIDWNQRVPARGNLHFIHLKYATVNRSGKSIAGKLDFTAELYDSFQLSNTGLYWNAIRRYELDVDSQSLSLQLQDPTDELLLEYDKHKFMVAAHRFQLGRWLVTVTPLSTLANGSFSEALLLSSKTQDGTTVGPVRVPLTGDVRDSFYASPDRVVSSVRCTNEEIPVTLFVGSTERKHFEITDIQSHNDAVHVSATTFDKMADGVNCRITLQSALTGEVSVRLSANGVSQDGTHFSVDVPALLLLIPVTGATR